LPDVPPFYYSAAARIEFPESHFRIANATPVFLRWPGEPRGRNAAGRPDRDHAGGTATPAGVRRLTDIALVQRVLDRAQGKNALRGGANSARGRTERTWKPRSPGGRSTCLHRCKRLRLKNGRRALKSCRKGDAAGVTRTDRMRC